MSHLVLGINAYHGDAAAVLLEEGRVVAAIEEERITRQKHAAGFPAAAIRAVLAQGGVRPEDLSAVAVSRRPRAHLLHKILYALGNPRGLGATAARLRNAARIRDVRGGLAAALDVEPESLPRPVGVEHHRAHLASALFTSGWEQAALLSIDGFGDFVSTKLARGEGRRMRILSQVEYPHSLGIVYTAVTQFLGFPHYGDEGKVMGLAAHGSPTFRPDFDRIIQLRPGGFTLDLSYLRHPSEGVTMTWEEGSPSIGPLWTEQMEDLFGPPRAPDSPLTDRDRDLAASLQGALEDALMHLLRGLHQRTGCDRVCLAGGVAYNCAANGLVRARSPFQEVHLPCAAGDSGTALGAAYAAHLASGGGDLPREPHRPYLGDEYRDEELLRAAEAAGYQPRTYPRDELLTAVAERIASGRVVGWFQGRMEFGPRALGNRSILADPRRAEMKEILNRRIKHRESFRPFAPSILEEELDAWFVDAHASPAMQFAFPIRPEKRDQIPAVTHVDGTGRVQTVCAEANPLFHGLIEAFARQTGIPLVLNTSFNENEPIVRTPDDALRCFRETEMDVLVLGSHVLDRPGADG